MTKTLNSTWIGRCPACRAHARVEAGTTVEMWNGKPAVRCACGVTMTAKLLKGVVTDHECDARCMSSKGHVCECSCGGANHGKAA
jgi:hypothetical protein